MRRVLFIEDDQFKRDAVMATLEAANNDLDVTQALSVQSALTEIEGGTFDLILLDMALPSHSVRAGESPAASMLSGGMEIIMELAYLHRAEPLIILTQYPELEVEGELLALPIAQVRLCEMFGASIKGVILYEHQATRWISELSDELEKLSANFGA